MYFLLISFVHITAGAVLSDCNCLVLLLLPFFYICYSQAPLLVMSTRFIKPTMQQIDCPQTDDQVELSSTLKIR